MSDKKAMRGQIWECYLQVYKEEPSDNHIAYLVFRLPQRIHAEASLWGWGDTVLGGNIIEEFEENKEIYKEEK